MRAYQHSVGILTGAAAIVLVAAQTVGAAEVQITGAQLQPWEGGGIRLLLETAGSSEVPQVMVIPKSGNRLEAAILNSQLYLGSGDRLRQENPAPGIAAIEMWQGSPDSVFISVMGSNTQPVGQILQREAGTIVFGFEAGNSERLALQRTNDLPANPSPASPELPSALPLDSQFSPQPADGSDSASASPGTAATPPAPNPQPALPPFNPNFFSELAQRSDAIVPNAQITPEGNPAPLAQPTQPIVPVPPLLPQPVPPPVSPMAVGNVEVSQPILDLGTSVRVPRIVLQDAPAREVLSLLARSADLNLIFSEVPGDDDSIIFDSTAPGGEEGGPRISLDLRDESVQDVFNYVIQASGLEATRKGRTIFVGVRLPESAREAVSRTFRLNQVTASEASSFLSALGAETQIPFEQVQIQVIEVGNSSRLVTTRTPTILAVRAEENTRGPLPLRGLSVTSDNRLNTITVIGESHLVAMAGSYLTQLDARLRQVAVNIKVIDVNLNNIGRFGSSFSWGIGDTGIINSNGIGIINFGTDDSNLPLLQDGTGTAAPVDFQIDRGETAPANPVATFEGVGAAANTIPFRPAISSGSFDVVNAFLAQLQFSIQNNHAKILSDPTLIVQEGQLATVNLTQEVISNVETTREATGNTVTTTINVEKSEVGLILQIVVNRVDDNGFISMSVNPTINSIGQNTTIAAGDDTQEISLLTTRTLNSGDIRIRDGQTLILSGIIQDQERQQMQKIPILGDIPIIGSLFRRTIRNNQRAEVIVLVSPRILDDSQNANYGYTYTPSRDAREMLQERGFPTPPPQ
ncbi:MAG: secretin N-terminal domain-containing protein [Spirulina sp.]